MGLKLQMVPLFVVPQVLLRGSQHQLDTIQLVDLRSAGIIVDGHNIGTRVGTADFLDDTLAYDVVRQAGKWLGADNIVDALVDQF